LRIADSTTIRFHVFIAEPVGAFQLNEEAALYQNVGRVLSEHCPLYVTGNVRNSIRYAPRESAVEVDLDADRPGSTP
jgi:hypothetical protein